MINKGQKINDRYQVVKMIGEGGMANVYLAYDTILDRYVAVKVLRGDLATDEKFIRRFQREAIAASSLSHPNIVEIYDVGEDNGKYFIVMEYVNGKTLKSLVKKRGALTLHEVVDIMLQLTSAIACAHNSYIIHRDIKPQNILILDDGRVKITDFGIAMALNQKELTQTNSVMGSVHYLPPEQANGSGSTIKSDIYSLGILMYELLTGKVPFRGENAVEIAIKQMKEQIPSVCQINPDIPQSIENIILKACAKNPKNRYDSVSEMYQDLEVALKEENSNVRRIVYKYPEHELEETKVMPKVNEIKEKLKDQNSEDSMSDGNDKTINKILIILVSIFIGLVALGCLAIIIYPKLTEKPEITIPDVSGLTVVEAEKQLEKLGFVVSNDVEEKHNSDIEEGKVIGTKPQVGRSVKKGTTVTLIVSLGSRGITLEDYVGKNYYEVKATLEAVGINVIIEEKEVEDKTNVKADIIIEQSIEPGTELTEGDTIILYIPDIVTEYPDFVTEGWSVKEIEAFCDEYDINLNINYQETEEYPDGTVLAQSFPAGRRVVPNTTLTITVATPPVQEPIEEEPTE
ncbi:MAG: Stk1 family PASTA domain-containing Ser/Thr kinase [Mollicutes bacterium]|nr:Stk1 family PASTA domain-containing Ser/Thr kinase [Mollicutes bacterium]